MRSVFQKNIKMINADWKALKSQDIEEINKLNAIFIVAPRTVSERRLKQVIKHYLPKAPIIMGVSLEPYVIGFDQQPQFKMMEEDAFIPLVKAVQESSSSHKFHLLHYSQTLLADIVKQLDFKRVLLVNGSWKYAFHNSEASQILKDKKIAYKFISPFSDENEAHDYERRTTKDISVPQLNDALTDSQMIHTADEIAKQSYDYSFQTGALLGRKSGKKYDIVLAGFNKVIPYQTYALHHGNSREKYESLPHDTNHYDTIHAEMMIVTEALKRRIDLCETSLFVNLLPCPNCARTLSQTDISEVVYKHDHSDGYAETLLKLCGKKVRKVQ